MINDYQILHYQYLLFRLFFGIEQSYEVLNIESIRIIETSDNLKKYIGAITSLDSIISDNLWKNNSIPVDSKCGEIIGHLFDAIDNGGESNMHPYVYKTFKTFIQHKKKIKIDMDNIWKHLLDQKLLDLLFDSLEIQRYDKEARLSYWLDSDIFAKGNLIKSELFRILRNVKELHINTCSNYTALGNARDGSFPIPLLALLWRIKNTSINKVTIEIHDEEVSSRLKRYMMTETPSSYYLDSIKQIYEAKHFGIKLEMVHPYNININRY